MTDSDSQSVGLITLGFEIEFEQDFHHLLYLLFVGTAVTDDCFLDRSRRVFTDLKPGTDASTSSEAVPRRKAAEGRIHPATRIFMALRIAVNRELEVLSHFMAGVADWLNPAGRLCVLSFHSLEDRIVKQQIRTMEKGCICPPKAPECVCGKKPVMRSLTKKVVRPTEAEVARNPMARSTRLRAAERI